MTLRELNFRQLERIYVLANTPAYLVRNFASEESVQRLAQELPAAELARHLGAVGTASGIRNVVEAYAAIVALGLQGERLSQGLIESLEAAGLSWAAKVDALGKPSSTESSTATFHVQSARISVREPNRSSVSTDSQVDLDIRE